MIRIGTSGWLYPPWRGVFYPKGLPHRRELEYISGQLNSVEINGSFYSLQHPASYQSWHAQTPDDFVFAVKGSRFITHLKRLRDVQTPLANFFASGMLALGPKLGPVLWQLPATEPFDAEVLAAFFDLLPRSTAEAAELGARHDERMADRTWLAVEEDRPLRHALEVRHHGFTDPAFLDVLRAHGIAVVVADTAGKFPYLEAIATSLLDPASKTSVDFAYLRLHGDQELYVSGYTDAALDTWAARVREFVKAGDVFVYFDNDAKVRAPFDAMGLTERLATHG